MTLVPGSRLGPYEITAPLGEGGMGVVYRATDPKLKREVAIKVLPEAFAADADRLARFEREAQVLAQLHHPNIASIFGLEESGGVRALVMELAEGEDLADRLRRGPLPLDEALDAARQLVDALEAAHERGIVHRDLKPANIKLTPEGKVKVLDFGLAKALDPPATANSTTDPLRSPTLMNSATMTAAHGTRIGVLLGTAAYMSPEQARGQAVDERADIWAFGVVLLEMLTGRAPFTGDTVSDVLAAVLTREVPWGALPARTPAGVRRLRARCLERDPRKRLRDIGDARWELSEADGPEPPHRGTGVRPALTWAAWTVAAAAAGLAAWAVATRPVAAPPTPQGHFSISLPAEAPIVTLEVPGPSQSPLAVSPDGREVVYVAPHGDGTRLYARAMSDLTPRALPGTEGARAPFFSPDGKWVGFFADGKLRKAPLGGGTPTTLVDAPDGRGASWGPDGEIVFSPRVASGLFAVTESGGTPRPLTKLDFVAGDDGHGWPQVLAGHRAALFTVLSWSRETVDIDLVDLGTGKRRLVLAGVDFARYVPAAPGSATGHIVFVRDGTLVAAPFDPAGTTPAGPAVTVVESVRRAQFDISASGVLGYVPGPGAAPEYSLVSVDRAGRATPVNDQVLGYEDLHVSPDGRRVAMTIEEPGPDGTAAHVWLGDLLRGTLTRLTFEGYSRDPVWAPDGESVVYGSRRGESDFGLYLQRVDGRTPAERVWASPTPIWPDPQSFSPDGRTVVFTTKGAETSDDIWTLSLDGDRTARPWLETPATEWAGRLSPDGRFLAYNSDESGRDEVYVQPFPGPGGKWLVSQGGGINPIWSRDGRQLFYRRGGQFLAVDLETASGFTAGKPVPLFSGRYRETGRDFDVSPDGSRFVMMLNPDPRTAPSFNVLLDWRRALASRLGKDPS
jgi:serine/threonine-protein kinase